MLDYDLLVAIGLGVVIVVLFLVTKIAQAPRKGLIYVAGAALGAVGIVLFNRQRTNSLKKELARREKELEKREEKLANLQNRYEASYDQLEPVKAELAKHRAVYQKEILRNEAKTKKEKAEIEQLSGDDLHDAFFDAFSN